MLSWVQGWPELIGGLSEVEGKPKDSDGPSIVVGFVELRARFIGHCSLRRSPQLRLCGQKLLLDSGVSTDAALLRKVPVGEPHPREKSTLWLKCSTLLLVGVMDC